RHPYPPLPALGAPVLWKRTSAATASQSPKTAPRMCRPSHRIALAGPLERDRPKRRQRQRQRMILTVIRDRRRFHAAEVPVVASAVHRRVRVEHLAPPPPARRA